MSGCAVFLNGPVGVGKSTLGRAVAASLGAGFIDGDDHADPDRAWYGSIRRTSAAIAETGLRLLQSRPFVVVAYPLGCVTWIYHRRKFADAGALPLFITLRASFEEITQPARGRHFSPGERDRIRVMIAEGYADRPFSDLIVDVGDSSTTENTDRILAGLQRLMIRPAL